MGWPDYETERTLLLILFLALCAGVLLYVAYDTRRNR